uniref:ATP synthase Fo subunit 8 n=1 Tax=Caridina brevicarpalis TaxID=382062 RepID=A0A3Q8LYD4_9EUCA|nr:ATP synthase Fo subunit 8 [Caridina brevicarpalis]
MAPLFWLNLFIFFTIIYTLFLISNYFLKVPETSQSAPMFKAPQKLNWKW